jgi:HD superfamily phosphodiesterase
MPTTTREITEVATISGVMIPDSKLAREATELVCDTESPLLFTHSTRVCYFGALAGKRRGLVYDSELLYVGAMFHDVGLAPQYSSETDRFEVDGANGARAFPGHGYHVDGDCPAHHTGYPVVHASGSWPPDSRC